MATETAALEARMDALLEKDSLINAAVCELRADFQRFTERLGQRISDIEKQAARQEAIVEGVVVEVKTLRENDARDAARLAAVETLLDDFKSIKAAAIGQFVALLMVGALAAWVLLR